MRALFVYLEDRRALFDHFSVEVPEAVFASLLDIREKLTDTIQALPESSPAVDVLKRIRGACSAYLSGPGRQAGFGYGFWIGLGELRGFIGSQLAILAEVYGIQVRGPLAAILPATLEEDKALEAARLEYVPPRELYVPPPTFPTDDTNS
jgi:hypothetical protein